MPNAIFPSSSLLHPAWFALFLVLGCGEEVDEAGATALWNEIQAASYRDWERAPNYDTPQPTIRAHGDTALVFLNPVMSDAAAGPAIQVWPEGALLVKDSYGGSNLKLVAAIKKRADGWYFAEWNPDGEVKYAGTPDVCTNCHTAGDDNVLSVAFPE